MCPDDAVGDRAERGLACALGCRVVSVESSSRQKDQRKTFCHDAVRAPPDPTAVEYPVSKLTSVAPSTTTTVMTARRWLAMPNYGNSVLMPPSGSPTPSSRMLPHAATTTKLCLTPGRQLGFCSLRSTPKLPSASEIMQRAASGAGVDGGEDEQSLKHDREVITERLEVYHTADHSRCSISAMPNASVGAPPVRDTIVCSPMLAAAWLMWLRHSRARQTGAR